MLNRFVTCETRKVRRRDETRRREETRKVARAMFVYARFYVQTVTYEHLCENNLKLQCLFPREISIAII